jgi:glycosyltransferase involved in cell wall biosynthesis
MRIIIDLQPFQSGAAPRALALAQDLARTAGIHEVWIALSDRYPGSIEGLRFAFAMLLPRERVRVFDLPAPGKAAGAEWRARAAELIRDNFMAVLDADVVFMPHPAAGAGVVCGPASDNAPFATVFGESANDSAARIWERLDASTGARRPAAVARPRLAYISPLPPEKSGIADYSAELVPELARFYDVELIVDQASVSDPRLTNKYPLHQLDWFERHAHRFDRVLYHFGNSDMHKHMFELIRRHPGIVVLHDFFLSNALDTIERDGYLPQGYLSNLYDSHGYSGLLQYHQIGRNPSIWKYPLNKAVLDHASGVIVHSEFSRQLAIDWYGPAAANGWRTVPLLRGKPPSSGGTDARAAARARLKLKDDEFLVCSFGMLGVTKLNEQLLDAFLASPLAANRRCKLVFVGQNVPGRYGATLTDKIARSVAARRIAITGFTSPDAYAGYLAACDAAVQLRSSTRGESSAAVLDCLLWGVPTIVNAHGSSAAIRPDVLLKLPDQFTTAELSAALVQLHGDSTLRAGLSQRAQALMEAEHAPGHVGQLYFDAIEHLAVHGRQYHYQALIDALVRLPGPGEPSAAELADVVKAIAFNQGPSGPRQLLVDVSAVVHSDLKTGIQRVVRSVLLALIANPPAGFRVEPVFSTGGNRNYQYARHFTLGMVGECELALEDGAPVDLRPGDAFLGLDLFAHGIAQNHELLQSMRDHGIKIYFVIFDLLPMLRPDAFPFGTEKHFAAFLHTVSTVADGLLCISRAVADELIEWIGRHGLPREAPLQVGYFHLGADIGASAPSFGLPPNAAQVLESVRARPSFLMVGTVEPRKAHAQALAAFELLWRKGKQINLVIVGKQGWMVEQLADRMANHPEKDKRLFWLSGISDEMLLKLYAGSAALLSPSEGEGFGLPLIEAAQHDIPIIARNLPVFREVAGEHAYYFDGLAPSDLSAAVEAWLALQREGKAPASTGMRWLTWSETAQQLLNAIEHQHWYREIPGSRDADADRAA